MSAHLILNKWLAPTGLVPDLPVRVSERHLLGGQIGAQMTPVSAAVISRWSLIEGQSRESKRVSRAV